MTVSVHATPPSSNAPEKRSKVAQTSVFEVCGWSTMNQEKAADLHRRSALPACKRKNRIVMRCRAQRCATRGARIREGRHRGYTASMVEGGLGAML